MNDAAAKPPKTTLVTPVKFVPVMVVEVPPAIGPEVGEIEVTVGAGTTKVNPPLGTVRVNVASSKFACAAVPVTLVIWHQRRMKLFPAGTV